MSHRTINECQHEIIGKNMGYKGKMIGGKLAKKDVEGH